MKSIYSSSTFPFLHDIVSVLLTSGVSTRGKDSRGNSSKPPDFKPPSLTHPDSFTPNSGSTSFDSSNNFSSSSSCTHISHSSLVSLLSSDSPPSSLNSSQLAILPNIQKALRDHSNLTPQLAFFNKQNNGCFLLFQNNENNGFILYEVDKADSYKINIKPIINKGNGTYEIVFEDSNFNSYTISRTNSGVSIQGNILTGVSLPPLSEFIASNDKTSVLLHAELAEGTEGIISVGRLDSNTIQIPETFGAISRNHFQIKRNSKGELELTDTSTFGTTIMSKKGYIREIKKNSTVINVGDAIILPGGIVLKVSINNNVLTLTGELDTTPSLPIDSPYKISPPSKKAVEQSKKFYNSHQLTEKICDGYRDGGRDVGFNYDGSPANQLRREVIVIDRNADVILRQTIQSPTVQRIKKEFLSGESSQMEAIKDLAKYVEKIFRRSDSLNVIERLPRREVLLGELIDLRAGVCRHQALLFKILADEVFDDKIPVCLVRGNYDGGGHVWPTVELEDGKALIVDTSAGQLVFTTQEAASNYQDIEGNKMYK